MKPLWQPNKLRAAQSQMTHFQSFAEERFKRSFLSYNDLHHWSVTETAEFWEAVWYFCKVKAASAFSEVVRQLDQFPGTEWFTHSRLNFAENLLAHRDDQIAIIGLLENGERSAYTYAELYTEVERLASAMRRHGITNGDTVAGLLPNIPEAVIAMLATTSIGAIWSSCSPDFGVNGACDRFGQIEPRLLFTTESYLYNGKTVDCLDKVSRITQNIESIEATIVVPLINQQPDLTKIKSARLYKEFVAGDITPLKFK
ncbi:MAG: acetoacetyl-CoA synthetase, partial [Candidatus Azotimanducaceae bacterium]